MTDLQSTTNAAARVVNLTKTYGAGPAMVTALDDVTLDLAAGEFTAVMGPSGSGKSTLMHCCAALDTADSGSVFIGEQDLSTLKDKAPDPAPQGRDRVRLPVLQPGAHPDRRVRTSCSRWRSRVASPNPTGTTA